MKQTLTKSEFGKELRDAILGSLVLLFLAYLAIGLCSVAEVSEGAGHGYNAFWHAPWKFLFSIFGR